MHEGRTQENPAREHSVLRVQSQRSVGCPSRDRSLLTEKQRQAVQELTESSRISPAMELMVPKPV